MSLRPVVRVVRGMETSDGAGVRLVRMLGTPELSDLDPFLMLDNFKSDSPDDYIAGFPDHPHRGFETVTYMLAGAMEHRDHRGNRGLLGPGSVQWMTAGRGIVHSEMPRQENGLMWGFQLWINLPAALKMCEPRYQDIAAEGIPERMVGDARVRVIAGSSGDVAGAVQEIYTNPLFLDVALPAGATFEHPVPAGYSAFACAFEGAVAFDGHAWPVQAGQLAVFGDGDAVKVTAGDSGGRFILLAAQPLREPIARYGPFVMNTRQELEQAFADFRSGKF
ncbi:MAG: pirin family protein [Vicinamibacteria bacterium]|nr:pirin family protein [Vicinamibacteria bacterium]